MWSTLQPKTQIWGTAVIVQIGHRLEYRDGLIIYFRESHDLQFEFVHCYLTLASWAVGSVILRVLQSSAGKEAQPVSRNVKRITSDKLYMAPHHCRQHWSCQGCVSWSPQRELHHPSCQGGGLEPNEALRVPVWRRRRLPRR